MSEKSRSVAVVGLGAFGSQVASELCRFGNFVLAIDIDERRVSAIAEEVSQAVIADGADEIALREAGMGHCEVAVVAIGENLEANILCAMNARLLGIETIWAKAISRTHHRILSKIGVERIVHAERDMGQRVAEMLHNPLVRDYVSIGNGYHMVDFVAPERLEGRSLASLKLTDDHDLRCLGVMRGSEFIDCASADPTLEKGDYVLLLGRRTNLRRFADGL